MVPAVSNDHRYPGPAGAPASHGSAADAALGLGPWRDHDVYVCGSAEMTTATVAQFHAAGIDPALIHHEDYTDEPFRPTDLSAPDLEEARPAWQHASATAI